MSASKTPETTKVSWMSTIQRRRIASTAVVRLPSKRKERSSAMALIATMEAMTLSLRSAKSMVPSQVGRSSCSPM